MPDDRKNRFRVPSSSTDYEIGYCKPPKTSRFKVGQSGNPKGRPKGARNNSHAPDDERLKAIIINEAYRTIKVNEGNRQITVPIAQAVIRSLAVNAARGQHRAQQLFAELLSETERANKHLNDRYLQAAIGYKWHWDQELERRARLGFTGPEPLPHPDDIVIDRKTGQVLIKGPSTKEEKAEWDKMYKRLEDGDREIEELMARLQDPENEPYRQIIEKDIAFQKSIREIIVNTVGEPKDRKRR